MINFSPKISSKQIDKSLVDYVNILYNILGIDIDYERFQQMTDDERKSFIRDLKINKIVNGND